MSGRTLKISNLSEDDVGNDDLSRIAFFKAMEGVLEKLVNHVPEPRNHVFMVFDRDDALVKVATSKAAWPKAVREVHITSQRQDGSAIRVSGSAVHEDTFKSAFGRMKTDVAKQACQPAKDGTVRVLVIAHGDASLVYMPIYWMPNASKGDA
jgi:hypothetical protein